jgi:hypothetical protein
MIPEEVDALFNTHADFIANTRILSLAPVVQNINILRTENSSHDTTTLEREVEDGQHLCKITMAQAGNVTQNCWFPSRIWKKHVQP